MESIQKPIHSLVSGIADVVIHGSENVVVNKIIIDSRRVLPGSLFVALRGTQVDGHQFMDTAADLGAVAILCEELPQTLREGVSYIQVIDSAEAMGYVAASFYDQPSKKVNTCWA